MSLLFLALVGVAVGAANVMPGVSGATLAVIFQVYDRLITAINELTKDWKKSLRFLIPFGLGMAAGVVAVGSLISILIGMFSFQSAGFIAGLMAGSIPFLYGQATAAGGKKVSYYIAAFISAAVIILLTVFVPAPELYMDGTPGLWGVVLLILGGALAAAAMVVPGASGAMVLILLGLYPLVMDTINEIREYVSSPLSFGLLPSILWVAVPIGLGIIPGILLASKGIALLLKKYYALTYFIIIGLVLGTVFALFNDPDTYQSGDITPLVAVTAAAAFIIGVVLALLLGRKRA